MADRPPGQRPTVTLPEAAEYLNLSVEAVQALVGAGYLTPDAAGSGDFRLPMADLKAFLARNADNGIGAMMGLEVEGTGAADPQALLDALDGRADEMARRAFEIFSAVFPEATGWTITEQARFIDQAKSRFEAILAVTGLGAEVDEALVGDLQEVGAAAAWEGSPLPQLLVILRISRDLVVQTAVELAEERGRHWGLALSLLLTRVLPAMDRLTDALAQGYWAAILGREEEAKARYQNVVEHSSDGIYEVDLDGCISYVNESLAIIVGRTAAELEGTRLSEVLQPLEESVPVNSLITESTAHAAQRFELTIARADGVRRVLDVRTLPRLQDGELHGFQGVVRDVTTAHDLEAEKNEFLALVTHDLRNPLTTILGLGATLESHAEELEAARIRRMGGSIRRQAERMSRLADDLYDMSRLEAQALLLTPRPVDVAAIAEAALAAVDGDTSTVEIRVPSGITVMADPRRLEQVIANLVENGLQHGAPPVYVDLLDDPESGFVELRVADHGDGVPAAVVGTLFNRARTLGRRNRDRSRGTGLGLSLVRGLVEAMGGRVWYEARTEGGSSFRLSLPIPRRRF
ncbi:MAG: two-component system, OmpR family, phosphate regulon sensor histidine kinase PhoR [Acidimicrobiaceae bacterium]|nr:two-component system, OmpR family, phosphate regulon sensor histidine kinase PhoR [Acidimicrobiaceae bacterium]MDQ1445898.1 two-component system, OmpR family, phosphate regulon sensor histidine kinase PhoR [Acidimicrobiaceae bacterium]